MALVLAALGICGVIAASVTTRTREIGIRMALGAAPARVRRAMLGEAAILAGVGVVAGVVAALAVSRVVSSLVFGVSALDPTTFVAAPISLLVVGLVAALLPALRAARTNPGTALRAESSRRAAWIGAGRFRPRTLISRRCTRQPFHAVSALNK